MKYLGALIFSIILIPILISQTETVLFWRKRIHKHEKPEEMRKKEYKELAIFWAIATVAAFIFVTFFVE